MNSRHSQYDVTNTVKVTDSQAVCNAVCDIFHSCYLAADDSRIRQAFEDFDSLFEGHYNGFNACDTFYHDKQHTLDMTLALARLIDGHERQSDRVHTFGAKLTSLAIITALFHDSGYIRKTDDQKFYNGAQYTPIHVSRSATFLTNYLHMIGLPEFADIAANMVHYTGYEVSPDQIKLPDEKLHLLGYMLGTADLIAQMSDRCYLEKCKERLFPEFELGGMTSTQDKDGKSIIIFESADDLLAKTPTFYNSEVKNRLNNLFQQVYKYAEAHFGDDNLYIKYLNKNISHIESLIETNKLDTLHRLPPENPGTSRFLNSH
ncbi:MAG: hypothetical protein DIZ80_02885 [endosymbiont of Galathealinum brachiosum]|uniref:HD/PDEase domain-containing protein n=1 Tax=endosymbiont of Galathealinum brachiosum TaxID=2200906 RepID=A0A370DIR3_9GAMM|nr:MAG: hypothetical protein DIZ80_02885 [endosymbiont of Galathealinum brachiosum]